MKIAMGVDPGFAVMGMGVVQADDDYIRLVAARVATTKSIPAKELRRLKKRKTNADAERHASLAYQFSDYIRTYKPDMIGVEASRVARQWGKENEFRGQNQEKVMAVYSGVLWNCAALNIMARPFLPDDLKRGFCQNRSAEKKEVEDAVCEIVTGLREFLDVTPKTKREHIADAVGHAVLALRADNERFKKND